MLAPASGEVNLGGSACAAGTPQSLLGLDQWMTLAGLNSAQANP